MLHAQKFSGARQHDDKEKICKTFLLLRPKATTVIFLIFVVCRWYLLQQQKMLPKCCPTIKKTFLFRTFFSKSLSNVSTDPGHRCYTFLTKIVHTKKIFTFSTLRCFSSKLTVQKLSFDHKVHCPKKSNEILNY